MGIVAAAALAVGAVAQTVKVVEAKKAPKESTYVVTIDGKVVAKGKIGNGHGPKKIVVTVDGKSVVERDVAPGVRTRKYVIVSADGDKGPRTRIYAKAVPEPMPQPGHLNKRFVIVEGEGKEQILEAQPRLKPVPLPSIEQRLRSLEQRLGKLEQMMGMMPGRGTWELEEDDNNGKPFVWRFDTKQLEGMEKGLKLEELEKQLQKGLKDRVWASPPNVMLFKGDAGEAPQVRFEDDGSYKVTLGPKVLAEGKVDPKEPRTVSVTVMNGKYRVEVNGKVVAEGEAPDKK